MNIKPTLESLNAMSAGNMGEHLGIEFTGFGDDYICGRMPVDHRTRQPMGLLHGGASAAFAETLGSVGSVMLIDTEYQSVVGVEINANHLRKVTAGFVSGKATLVMRSRKLHVWDIRITNEDDELVCLSRLTVMILERGVK
jgi:1,4-dihydroxy-2-naphthoyl-CoA hydrolase